MPDKNMEAEIKVEFEEASSRQSLNSGENTNTLWGKVKKFLSDLKSVAFSGAYSDLSGTPTTATTSADGLMSASDKGKLDSVDDTYALKSKYGDTTINVGRKASTIVGSCSVAEGSNTTASGTCSHAENAETTASGDFSHAEGLQTTAAQSYTHAEGYNTSSNAPAAHAEGVSSIAAGQASHAEGQGTQAVGNNSHSGGYGANSFNNSSFSHGIYTIANKDGEIAFGKYNKSNDDTVFSVGDGTSDSARHNAFEITTKGGKLHDKDIATTDLIPTTLPANGGNADYAANAGKLGGLDASAYSTSIIKSIVFSAATTNGYIWTGIAFPKYIVGIDLEYFDVIVQFYKGNHVDAARAEWAMMFLSKDDVTTPLNGSFTGRIYYID